MKFCLLVLHAGVHVVREMQNELAKLLTHSGHSWIVERILKSQFKRQAMAKDGNCFFHAVVALFDFMRRSEMHFADKPLPKNTADCRAFLLPTLESFFTVLDNGKLSQSVLNNMYSKLGIDNREEASLSEDERDMLRSYIGTDVSDSLIGDIRYKHNGCILAWQLLVGTGAVSHVVCFTRKFYGGCGIHVVDNGNCTMESRDAPVLFLLESGVGQSLHYDLCVLSKIDSSQTLQSILDEEYEYFGNLIAMDVRRYTFTLELCSSYHGGKNHL
jgi:hypothetical protein